MWFAYLYVFVFFFFSFCYFFVLHISCHKNVFCNSTPNVQQFSLARSLSHTLTLTVVQLFANICTYSEVSHLTLAFSGSLVCCSAPFTHTSISLCLQVFVIFCKIFVLFFGFLFETIFYTAFEDELKSSVEGEKYKEIYEKMKNI